MKRRSEERRLAALRDEVPQLREQRRMLDEQVAYVAAIADDARVRASVAETPLADREREQAEDDLRRASAQRDEVAQRLEDIRAEQDRLLERMFGRREQVR